MGVAPWFFPRAVGFRLPFLRSNGFTGVFGVGFGDSGEGRLARSSLSVGRMDFCQEGKHVSMFHNMAETARELLLGPCKN